MHYRFEWDAGKAAENLRKHGISFDEARTVYADLFATESFDRQHSIDEDRFMIIGMSARGRLLVVAFTPRDYRTIRIISARHALRNEQRQYEEQTRRGGR